MPTTVQVTGFGMTETGGSVVLSRPDEPRDLRLGAEGAPYPGMELEIRDVDTAAALSVGERGEIVVRGPQVFNGYFKSPEKNAEVLEPAGWFHTGDLGGARRVGRLHYLGRAKDMLKVGGENVAAIEIESLPRDASGGVDRPGGGSARRRYVEVPAAFLQLQPGTTVTEGEIIAFCQGAMASFKVPRYVRWSASGRCRRPRCRSSDCATSWSPSGHRTRRTDNQPTVPSGTLTTTRKGRD